MSVVTTSCPPPVRDEAVERVMASRAPDPLSVSVRPCGDPRKGDGLFATRRFSAGEEIGAFGGVVLHRHAASAADLVSDTEALKLARAGLAPRAHDAVFETLDACIRVKGWGWLAVKICPRPGDFLRKSNHSCAPNCRITPDEATGVPILKAETEVREGDEITWDYRAFTNRKEEEAACLCGAGDACRGTLVTYAPPVDCNRAATFAWCLGLALRACYDPLRSEDVALLGRRKFDGPMYVALPPWAQKWAAAVLAAVCPDSAEEVMLRACLAKIEFVQRAAAARIDPPFDVWDGAPGFLLWKLCKNPPPRVDVTGYVSYTIHRRAVGASMVYFTNTVQATPHASFSRDCHSHCELVEHSRTGSVFRVPRAVVFPA